MQLNVGDASQSFSGAVNLPIADGVPGAVR